MLEELGATGVHASVVGSPFVVSCTLGEVSVELEVCEVEGISKVCMGITWDFCVVFCC